MEQFVLVPASVFNNNKSLNTQAFTRQELPKYQAEQNLTYQIDSLRKEINKTLFAKGDSLFFFLSRIKLSNSQTLLLDGVETGVLLSDLAQQLRGKNANVPDIYFTLLAVAVICPTLVLNQNAKERERVSGVPFKR